MLLLSCLLQDVLMWMGVGELSQEEEDLDLFMEEVKRLLPVCSSDLKWAFVWPNVIRGSLFLLWFSLLQNSKFFSKTGTKDNCKFAGLVTDLENLSSTQTWSSHSHQHNNKRGRGADDICSDWSYPNYWIVHTKDILWWNKEYHLEIAYVLPSSTKPQFNFVKK